MAVALLGAWIGLALGAQRSDQVGPLIVSSEVTFSLTGDTVVDVPPLGTIELDTHDGPLALHAQVDSLDNDVTQDALDGDLRITNLDEVPNEVRGLLLRTYLQALIVCGRRCGISGAGCMAASAVGRRSLLSVPQASWCWGRCWCSHVEQPRAGATALHRAAGVRPAGGR